MRRCEDFPCCGHTLEDGCPDDTPGLLPYPCIGCGKRIPVAEAQSGHESFCGPCLHSGQAFCEGPDCPGCSWCMGEDEDEDDEEEVQA